MSLIREVRKISIVGAIDQQQDASLHLSAQLRQHLSHDQARKTGLNHFILFVQLSDR